MTDLRKRYHVFLNKPASREVEPNELLGNLRPNRLFDEEEEELVRNEPTLALRQFCFFLKLLPTKGPAARDIIDGALWRCGYPLAAREWEQCTKQPGDEVPDGFIVPVQAEQYQATPARTTTVIYERQYRTSARAPPIGAVIEGEPCADSGAISPEVFVKVDARSLLVQPTPSAAAQEPPQPPPPGFILPAPPPSTARLLRTNFVQAAAPAAPAAQSRIEYSSNERVEIVSDDRESVEDVARVMYSDGLGGPPSVPRLSTDLGSAGIPSRTPESFFESQPSFLPQSKVAVEGASIDKAIRKHEVHLGDEIGRGFFAVVHVGQYAGRKVAVKKFRDYDEFSLAMFLEEINIMRDLNHRNVVRLVGFVHEPQDRQLWLLSEFVAGGALRRFCTPVGSKTQLERSLPLRDKVKIAIDCWQGLDYIHGKSLCHKDISPGNILVSNDLTQVKISDFGLAEFKSVIMTAMTQVSGTPMYYPPEFASADGVIRHPVKSDIYSTGASLCELFSEQWFWNMNGQARNQFQVMFMLSEAQRLWTDKHQMKDPDCWDKLPPVVQPMLKDAITPDYRKRKSARELAVASQEILKELK